MFMADSPLLRTDQPALQKRCHLVNAWEQFVRDFQHQAVGYFRSMGMDTHTAEDLAQDSFIQAYTSIHTLRDGAKLLPWLYTIMSRAGFRHLESQAATRTDALIAEPILKEFGHQDVQSLRAAMASLTPRDRELLYLRHVTGLSAHEIGGIVGVGAGAVRFRLWSIRRKLTKGLE